MDGPYGKRPWSTTVSAGIQKFPFQVRAVLKAIVISLFIFAVSVHAFLIAILNDGIFF
jgi:hypothetical protein